MSKRIRRVGSIKSELLTKYREAVLAAVQIYNNPNISFKSESYSGGKAKCKIKSMLTFLLHDNICDVSVRNKSYKEAGDG